MGEKRAILSREQIRTVSDLITEIVDVPEWGGAVRVRGLTGRERDQWEDYIIQPVGQGKVNLNMNNASALLVVLGAIDDDGNRLFTMDDLEWLGEKNGAAVNRLAARIRELSGLTASSVEIARKN